MTVAIKTLADQWAKTNANLSGMPFKNGADFFSRTGEWVTIYLEQLAENWTCCELNEVYRDELCSNMPSAKVVIGDSFEYVTRPELYDVILADCPQGVFGPSARYCEHFEFLDLALSRLSDTAGLFFNVNIRPYWSPTHAANSTDNYGMTDPQDWFERRNEFYSCDASDLSLDFVRKFYRSIFQQHGFDTHQFLAQLEPSSLPGHDPFILRCLVKLIRL